jgi:mevalonate kinase
VGGGWGVRFTAFSTPEPVDIEFPEAVLGFTKKKYEPSLFASSSRSVLASKPQIFSGFFRYAGSKDALTARMLHLEKEHSLRKNLEKEQRVCSDIEVTICYGNHPSSPLVTGFISQNSEYRKGTPGNV